MTASPAILQALAAAALFGASAPLAKLLLAQSSPWLMAGLLYAGSGLGLLLWRLITRAPSVHMHASGFGGIGPAALVLGACLCWAVDNNLTRQVSLADASFIAMAKGLAAGGVNLLLAWQTGAAWPGLGVAAAAGLLGLLAYGVSLVLFVVALRALGTARTGAYFSVAPFFGAALSALAAPAAHAADGWQWLPAVNDPTWKPEASLALTGSRVGPGTGPNANGWGLDLNFNCGLVQTPDKRIRSHVNVTHTSKNGTSVNAFEVSPRYTVPLGVGAAAGMNYRAGMLYTGVDIRDHATTSRSGVDHDPLTFGAKVGINF